MQDFHTDALSPNVQAKLAKSLKELHRAANNKTSLGITFTSPTDLRRVLKDYKRLAELVNYLSTRG